MTVSMYSIDWVLMFGLVSFADKGSLASHQSHGLAFTRNGIAMFGGSMLNV